MKRDFVRSIYEDPAAFGGKEVTVGGWVRNLRDSKAFGFIDLNDGSCFKCVQVVFEREKIANYDEIARQNVGASLVVKGVVELTPNMKQPFELKATEIAVEGTSTPEYPLQPKRHSVEFLREQVRLIKPKIIVCLGRIAAMRLIKPDFKITKEHGEWFEKGNFVMTAVYHPALLLRDPRRKEEMLVDMKAIKAKLSELSGN